MALFQDTCKLVPGLPPTRKILVTQIRDLGGWIKDNVSGPHSGFEQLPVGSGGAYLFFFLVLYRGIAN